MLNHTEILLKNLSGGELQQLALRLLPRIDERYQHMIGSGIVEGTSKTRKGVPDSWVFTTNDEIIHVEVTANQNRKKLGKDFETNIPLFNQQVYRKKEYVCFINFEPKKIIENLKNVCTQNGIHMELYNNNRIATILDKPEFHDVRMDFLRIPPSLGVFLRLEEFRERLRRKRAKLPIPENFIGREVDVHKVVDAFSNIARIVIVDGDPGVGKTRLSTEAIQRLSTDERFSEFEFHCVRELNESITQAIRSELDLAKKHLLFVDDANRLNYLGDLLEMLVNPKITEGSRLLLSTRRYNTQAVISEINKHGIHDSIAVVHLHRLSNADIDQIVQGEPFNIKGEHYRRIIVSVAKGNPRLATLSAEIIRHGGSIEGDNPPQLFEKYFEDVFCDIDEQLSESKDKRLLGLFAALRFIDPSNDQLVKKIVEGIGFSNTIEFRESLVRLSNSEILDVLPSGTVARVFDDSVSEYLVFRFFFHDKHGFLDFIAFVLQPFGSTHEKTIFENLVAITDKGYTSNRLRTILSNLLLQVRDVLHDRTIGLSQRESHLKWLKQIARTSPNKSFEIARDYLHSKEIEEFSAGEAESIVEVVKYVAYYDPEILIPETFHVLRTIALAKKTDLSTASKFARDALVNAFKYDSPLQVDENRVRWNYRPQQILVSELEQIIARVPKDIDEIRLYIELATQLCQNHFDDTKMDFLDSHQVIMSAGPLHLIDALRETRSKTFQILVTLYQWLPEYPKERLLIIEAFRRSFQQIYNPSTELLKFDADIILDHVGNIIAREKHYYILNRTTDLLYQIGNQKATELRKLIETPDFLLYQRFFGSFWEWRELRKRWEELQKQQQDFILSYVSTITLENYITKVEELTNYQKYACIEVNHSQLMGRTFLEVGKKLSTKVIEKITLIIENPSHPLFHYSHDLLVGMAIKSPAKKREIAIRWIHEQSIEKLRILASTYTRHATDVPTNEDLSILQELINLKDEQIDGHLVRALLLMERLNPDWVATNLLELAGRIPVQPFSDMLMYLEPSEGNQEDFHFKIPQTHPNIFKEIIFKTVRFPRLDEGSLGYHLSQCLRYLHTTDPDALFEYFDRRVNTYNELNKNRYYLYDVFPTYDVELSFIRSDKIFKPFLERILRSALGEKKRFRSWLELVPILYVHRGASPFDEEGPEMELDQPSFEVFSEWIEGTTEQLQLIVDLLCRLPLWKSWFDLVRQIVVRTNDSTLWGNLFSTLYLGGHSGPTSSFYKRRLKMVRSQLQVSDSYQMKQFLKEADDMLSRMIEREEEREKIENRWH